MDAPPIQYARTDDVGCAGLLRASWGVKYDEPGAVGLPT